MGRTATHVANKYHHPIFAKCDAERRRLVNFSRSSTAGGKGLEFSGSVSAQYDINLIQAGYSKILPHGYIKFQPDCHKTKTVYISIFSWDGNKFNLICDGLPKNEDMSVIVNSAGQVVDAKYRTIWTEK